MANPAETWKTDSTGSTNSSTSRSSMLFGLDEEDRSKILVYRYRGGQRELEVSSQEDLCKTLDSDPDKLLYTNVTKKKIPRGNSRLDICTEDLMRPEDVQKYSEKPTLKASLANVGLPSSAYWKRLLFDSFPELYIVSKTHTPSPHSSLNNSPDSSQHVSPSSTEPVDKSHPPRQS